MRKINVALKMEDFYVNELPALDGFQEDDAEGIAEFLQKEAYFFESEIDYEHKQTILNFLRKHPKAVCAVRYGYATKYYLYKKRAYAKTLPEYVIVSVNPEKEWYIQSVFGFQEVIYLTKKSNGQMVADNTEAERCSDDTENYRRVIFPDEKESAFISKILSREPKTEAECFTGTITYTAVFADGYEMDIKCCGVEYREGESNLPWTEAVLFRNGGEVCCTEPSEEFFGKWEMEADGKTFEVIIEA